MSSAAGPRCAVLTVGGEVPGWAGVQQVAETVPADPRWKDALLRERLGGVTAAFVAGDVPAPLSLVRRLHRLSPGLQITVVAEGEVRRRLQRAKLFTPGIGELWILEPGEVTGERVAEALAIGQARKAHAERSERVARQVASWDGVGARTPFLADHYLATLLELLPDPVLALDEAGRVIFTNAPAATVLRMDRGASLPEQELLDRLAPSAPEALRMLLEKGREGPVRGRIEAGKADGRRIWDIAAGPVSDGGSIRAVLLHDVTEEARVRRALEGQAAQLEEHREELRATAEQLRDQRDALRDLMEHRSRFYASMSHELRTPINAIIGYGDLLRDRVYGDLPPRQMDALERIGRAAKHLLDLVNDVLDLSKVEAGKISVTPAPLDVPDLVRDLQATMAPLAAEEGVELRFDLSDSCGDAFVTDPRRYRQILMNLVSNAIRYGAGAPVDVGCAIEDRTLSTEVADRGPGIPEEEREAIFQEFVQLGGESGGTGLGLPISRALARALGGDVTVTSREGGGSVFRVQVPWMEKAPG